MTGAEGAISALVNGVLLSALGAALNPLVILSVLVTCLLVRSSSAYLVAPVSGIATVAVFQGLMASDGFVSVYRFGWVISTAFGSVLVALVFRLILSRLFLSRRSA